MKVAIFRIFYGILLGIDVVISVLTLNDGVQLLDSPDIWVPTPQALVAFGSIQLICAVITISLCFKIKSKCLFFALLIFPILSLMISIAYLLWPLLRQGSLIYFPLISLSVHIGIVVLSFFLRKALLNQTNSVNYQHLVSHKSQQLDQSTALGYSQVFNQHQATPNPLINSNPQGYVPQQYYPPQQQYYQHQYVAQHYNPQPIQTVNNSQPFWVTPDQSIDHSISSTQPPATRQPLG